MGNSRNIEGFRGRRGFRSADFQPNKEPSLVDSVCDTVSTWVKGQVAAFKRKSVLSSAPLGIKWTSIPVKTIDEGALDAGDKVTGDFVRELLADVLTEKFGKNHIFFRIEDPRGDDFFVEVPTGSGVLEIKGAINEFNERINGRMVQLQVQDAPRLAE